jgi:predicted P-loop ATPase
MVVDMTNTFEGACKRADNQIKRNKQTKQIDHVLGNGQPRLLDGGQPHWPDRTATGPARTYRNARLAIQSLGIVCRYDQFHDRMLVGGHEIGQWEGELSDAVTVVLRQVIIEKFGFDPGKDHVADASTALCLENRFDPLLDYLDGLQWDGTPRLDRWLTTYLGAEDASLHRAVGRATLIAAVRRVRQPGCKFDHILTLEGPEGKGKSTAIQALAGVENFSDQTILSQSDKEQQELVRGIWLYEIADLAGLRRAEVEKVKAFASRTHDRARPAYGRRRIDAPRRCIFIATTNEDEYLKSQTGNRRFWPVAIGSIDMEGLRRDRDQLWAEAAQAETAGETITLAPELLATVAHAQDARREHDPWDDLLAGVDGTVYTASDGIGEEERISTEELYKVHLGIPATERVNTVHHQRLKRAMQRLGWQPRFLWFGASQKRGYFRTKRPAAEKL